MTTEKRFLRLADGLVERGAVGARAFDRPCRLREIPCAALESCARVALK
jgi:hypothetical protein